MTTRFGKMRLAIFTPQICGRSETFIMRHVRDLLPAETVLITKFQVTGDRAAPWNLDVPTLCLNQISPLTLKAQVRRAVAQRFGFRVRETDRVADTVKRFLEKHQVEVLMGEYLDQALYFMDIARDMGVRFVAHAHGYDVSERLRDARWQQEYLKYNQSDGVITPSESVRNRLCALGLRSDLVRAVPVGTDVPEASVLRPNKSPVQCFALGRMAEKKAPIMTLDAFRRAREMYPDLRLDYVGGGPLLSAAIHFVKAFQMEDVVTLYGYADDAQVQALWKRADIFVQHSMTDSVSGDEEGLPLSICEAMAQSLPVVSTRHAGIPEQVVEGVTGFLVGEGDSRSMAERIVTLARDPSLRMRMGCAAWERARSHFTWKRERAGLLQMLGLTS